MPRYVDVEKIEYFPLALYIHQFTTKDRIDRMPTADVVPVIHAHWIEQFEGTYLRRAMYCSACKKKSGIGGSKANQMKPYCPNCGAKMDETETEK